MSEYYRTAYFTLEPTVDECIFEDNDFWYRWKEETHTYPLVPESSESEAL